MGLDNVEVRCKLPDNAPEWLKQSPFFQTNDLGNGYSDYLISADGELQMARHVLTDVLMEAFGTNKEPPPMPVNFKRKRLELYASNLRGAGLRNGEYVTSPPTARTARASCTLSKSATAECRRSKRSAGRASPRCRWRGSDGKAGGRRH